MRRKRGRGKGNGPCLFRKGREVSFISALGSGGSWRGDSQCIPYLPESTHIAGYVAGDSFVWE